MLQTPNSIVINTCRHAASRPLTLHVLVLEPGPALSALFLSITPPALGEQGACCVLVSLWSPEV